MAPPIRAWQAAAQTTRRNPTVSASSMSTICRNLVRRRSLVTTATASPTLSSPVRLFTTGLRPHPFSQPRSSNLSINTSALSIRSYGSTSQNLLAHMEQTANNNPNSATAQNAFYTALLRANMPAIVVERYQTGRYATSAGCESAYQKALERLGLSQVDGGSAAISAGANASTANSGVTNEQLQAIGQAIAAQASGKNVAVSTNAAGAGNGGKSSPLYVVVDESRGAVIFKWVRFVAIWTFIGYVVFVGLMVLVESTGPLRRVGATQVSEVQAQQQKARFSDVKGADEAVDELRELVEFLKNPARFSNLGGKLPKGVLLVGPPGTGKTLLARAVAGEAGVPFFYMAGSEFDEVYVGVGAKRIRDLFAAARARAPAIIFIDELDAVGGKRNERDSAYVKQTLNQLLTELDGFTQETGVIILAATNFPKLLDKALTRPGRFDRNVVVPLPDVRGRMEILKFHMRKIKAEANVDASAIARQTPGFSGADLENLVNQAAIHASRQKQRATTLTDFDWAKDKILMGAERRSAVIQPKDRIMTAYHEAGHALVAMFTADADPVYKVTIMPRGAALGITFQMPEMDQVSVSKKQLLARIDVALGGKVAEEIIYGSDNATSGCASDLEKVTQIAYNMVTRMGFSSNLGDLDLDSRFDKLSPETKRAIDREVRTLVDEARNRAQTILETRREELDLLARALVDYEVLTLDEMKRVLKGETLPDKLAASSRTPFKLPEVNLPSPPSISPVNGPE